MEILSTMIFGLGLRFILSEPAQTQSKLYPAILGVWEGACLRYLLNRALHPNSVDPLLSYVVRLCIDFFITNSIVQLLIIVLWSFLVVVVLEAIDSGKPGPADGSPAAATYSSRDRTGSSLTKIRSIAVSSFPTPSTSASPTASVSIFSPPANPSEPHTPIAQSESLDPLQELTALPSEHAPTPPVPNLPSEASEEAPARSPFFSSSYTLPPPALMGEQSPAAQVETLFPLLLPGSAPSQAAFPTVEYEGEVTNDELQTPLPNADAPIANDDDELQTPLALPVPGMEFGDLIEPPDLELGPSMLLLRPSSTNDTPIRSSSTSPLPIPAPDPVQSTLLESPLSTLRALSTGSSSPVSPPASVFSAASPTRLYARADELRKQAWKEDRARTQLENELANARAQGRTKEVFFLLGDIRDAELRIERLHSRAKRRYYRARNKQDTNTLEIDVHGLLVTEAVEVTEAAFREVLRRGNRFLRVIVGKGNHSRDGVPKLRPAIIRTMQQHGFKCTVDFRNPGVVILEAP